VSVTFECDSQEILRVLVGSEGSNLGVLAALTKTTIKQNGTRITIDGEEARCTFALRMLRELHAVLALGDATIEAREIEDAVELLREHPEITLRELLGRHLATNFRRKSVRPLRLAQLRYVQAIEQHDLVFAIGPAGTGKTYLAVTMAFQALEQKRIDRIILTRPAVEAGEQLGFLPGDLYEKIQPYLRPLYDAAHDMIGVEKTGEHLRRGLIEIAPLAYMRGRTLNNCFIILDEAQNTTSQQMKMFLTRLGVHSRAVITGDITQIDLPREKLSGLVECREILHGIPGIAFQYFSERDVVRHRLVRQIVKAYDEYQKRERS